MNYFHMKLYESCWCVIGLTITLDFRIIFFLACDASSLVCSLPSWVLIQVVRGHTHPNPLMLEPLIHLPWLNAEVTPLVLTELSYLPLCEIVVKELPYDPLLGLLHQTIWGLIGTSYREDRLNMLAGLASSAISNMYIASSINSTTYPTCTEHHMHTHHIYIMKIVQYVFNTPYAIFTQPYLYHIIHNIA